MYFSSYIPGPQGSHLNHYSHWHITVKTGWKQLYPILSRQWLWVIFTDLPLNSVNKRLITDTFVIRKHSLGATEEEMCLWDTFVFVFQKTSTKFCGNTRNRQKTEIQGQTEALLKNSPKKLKNVQMAAAVPLEGWQIWDCEKITQVEASDRQVWVTERDEWQLFRQHESSAATGKQKLQWKLLEKAECSMMSAEMAENLNSPLQSSIFLLLSE